MSKEDRMPYVVDLPQINTAGVMIPEGLEITTSTSARTAVRNVIARNLTHGDRNEIGRAIVWLEKEGRSLDSYAVEIPTEFEDGNGKRISRRDPTYRSTQEIFLAQALADQEGSIKESRYLPRARRCIAAFHNQLEDFYNQ